MIFINAPAISPAMRSMASKLEQWRLLILRVIITAMTKFLVHITSLVASPLLFVTNPFSHCSKVEVLH